MQSAMHRLIVLLRILDKIKCEQKYRIILFNFEEVGLTVLFFSHGRIFVEVHCFLVTFLWLTLQDTVKGILILCLINLI